MNSYDSERSDYFCRYTDFSVLQTHYQKFNGRSISEDELSVLGLKEADGTLTNAGVLLADECAGNQSLLLCRRWNTSFLSPEQKTEIDHAVLSGSIIRQLDDGINFVQLHSSPIWTKGSQSCAELPDYCPESVFETLANAFIHRDYSFCKGIIFLDLFDDRLIINSPGGMTDEFRNPILAEVFRQIGYAKLNKSGIEKCICAYENAYYYSPVRMPRFYQDSQFYTAVLFNLNY